MVHDSFLRQFILGSMEQVQMGELQRIICL